MKAWLPSASALCLVVSSSALALTVEHKVTPEYVRSHPDEFSVTVIKDKNGLLAFTVALTLKEPRYVVAHLAVRDADRSLAESHTPAFTKNPENTFYFSIAPEYVATSEFTLGASCFAKSGGQAAPLPGTIHYQIRLAEFVAAELPKVETIGGPQRIPSRRPGPERDLQSLLRLARRLGIEPRVDKSKGGPEGTTLSVVPGGPAEEAGLRPGDEIAALNGVPFDRILDHIEDAPVLWGQLQLDDGLRLTVLREGKPVDIVLPAEVLRGFLGPRVEPLGGDFFEVTFNYRPSKPAKSVYLAGTFNNWGPTAHKMDAPDQGGLFTTRLKLRKGTYEYKFVLEGKDWKADPDNIYRVGLFQNSFLFVGVKR